MQGMIAVNPSGTGPSYVLKTLVEFSWVEGIVYAGIPVHFAG